MRRAVNIVVFYVGWFACANRAAAGYPWTGPLFVAVAVAAQLFWLTSPRRRLLLIATVGLVGMAVDAIHVRWGIVQFHEQSCLGACGAPPWMTALWINFGATLQESLSWLRRRPVVAAMVGGIGGPLSYLAGARLGAMTLGEPYAWSLGWIAVTWAIVTPVVFQLTLRRPFSTDADAADAGPLTVK